MIPSLSEAMEMLNGEAAERLVPRTHGPDCPCRACGVDFHMPRPCEDRTRLQILREISSVTFSMTNIAIESGDLQFGSELLRRLVEELAGAAR